MSKRRKMYPRKSVWIEFPDGRQIRWSSGKGETVTPLIDRWGNLWLNTPTSRGCHPRGTWVSVNGVRPAESSDDLPETAVDYFREGVARDPSKT